MCDALIARGLRDAPRVRSAAKTTARPTQTNTTTKAKPDDTAERSAFAQAIWRVAGDPRGTLAEKYLNLRLRGLDPPDDLYGRVLRFHPRCPFGEGASVPALIAAFRPIRDTDDDKPPVAIHRIGLTSKGEKITKKMLGPVAGCAVKLDADEAVSHGLGITEGIETALAVRAAGWRPVWALGSAGAISKFGPIAGIEALTIFADHDTSQAGQVAARVCAAGWSAAGHEVTIRTPRKPGADWADVP